MYQDGGGAPGQILWRDDHVETPPDINQLPAALKSLCRVKKRPWACFPSAGSLRHAKRPLGRTIVAGSSRTTNAADAPISFLNIRDIRGFFNIILNPHSSRTTSSCEGRACTHCESLRRRKPRYRISTRDADPESIASAACAAPSTRVQRCSRPSGPPPCWRSRSLAQARVLPRGFKSPSRRSPPHRVRRANRPPGAEPEILRRPEHLPHPSRLDQPDNGRSVERDLVQSVAAGHDDGARIDG